MRLLRGQPLFSQEKLAAKDAGLVQESAARHGLDLPVLAAIGRRLSKGAEHYGDKDISATYRTSAPAQRS